MHAVCHWNRFPRCIRNIMLHFIKHRFFYVHVEFLMKILLPFEIGAKKVNSIWTKTAEWKLEFKLNKTNVIVCNWRHFLCDLCDTKFTYVFWSILSGPNPMVSQMDRHSVSTSNGTIFVQKDFYPNNLRLSEIRTHLANLNSKTTSSRTSKPLIGQMSKSSLLWFQKKHHDLLTS